jgi:hypothetical protein
MPDTESEFYVAVYHDLVTLDRHYYYYEDGRTVVPLGSLVYLLEEVQVVNTPPRCMSRLRVNGTVVTGACIGRGRFSMRAVREAFPDLLDAPSPSPAGEEREGRAETPSGGPPSPVSDTISMLPVHLRDGVINAGRADLAVELEGLLSRRAVNGLAVWLRGYRKVRRARDMAAPTCCFCSGAACSHKFLYRGGGDQIVRFYQIPVEEDAL